ncbi:MAG: hypothetical protein R3F36_07955 [Candidatus Competibacteraceae bacterium]
MLSAHYRDLILYKTQADLRAEAAKTYIGFLWWVLDPLMFMMIFYVVFGLLLKRATPDFVPFLLIGLVCPAVVSVCISHGATAISRRPRSIKASLSTQGDSAPGRYPDRLGQIWRGARPNADLSLVGGVLV